MDLFKPFKPHALERFKGCVVNLLEVLGFGEGEWCAGGWGEEEGDREGVLDFSLEPQSSSHSLWCFFSAASILHECT